MTTRALSATEPHIAARSPRSERSGNPLELHAAISASTCQTTARVLSDASRAPAGDGGAPESAEADSSIEWARCEPVDLARLVARAAREAAVEHQATPLALELGDDALRVADPRLRDRKSVG